MRRESVVGEAPLCGGCGARLWTADGAVRASACPKMAAAGVAEERTKHAGKAAASCASRQQLCAGAGRGVSRS